MILRELYQNPSRRFPEKTAIVSGERRFTFKEAEIRINRLANALLDLGLKKGDRVAILDSNTPWYLNLYFAITGAGMVAVPLNYRLAPREYVYLLNQSESAGIFVGEKYTEMIDGIKEQLPLVKHYITQSEAEGYLSYEALMDGASPQAPEVPIDETDIATIGFTSGTTAQPKGAIISHRNIMANLYNYLIELPLYKDDICYNHFPMFHCGGYALLGYYGRGLTQVYDDFDLRNAFEVIQRERVNYWYIPAGALAFVPDFADHRKYEVGSLRVIYTGGSATRNPVVQGIFDMFPNLQSLHDIYGLTECTASVVARQITRNMLSNLSAIGEHCGPECFGVHTQLVDWEGNEVPRGQIGEVVVRSDTTCQGYWKKPDETESLFRGGWLHTGDMGRYDEDRNLYIVDRLKDMILSGGENISSCEVEGTLLLHPEVREAAVIGVSDEKWGERVHAVVVRTPGSELTDAALIAFCKENLASYKKPRSVDFVEELPRNPTGKILKKELRKRYQ